MAFDGTLQIELPPKLIPVFIGSARFRGAHGGRGSGKTRTFAKMAAVHGAKCAQEGTEGVILCGRQFMNSLADSSFSEIAAAISSDSWLATVYDIGDTYIRTKDRRVEFLFVGLARNLSSIKSKARILLCWIDEAEDVTEPAWVTLIPTVREDNSEIWITWNPGRKGSATDKRFRDTADADTKIVQLNYRDNPWFPQVLEIERMRDMRDRPDQYPHIWDGEYRQSAPGSYYAQCLAVARSQGRIGRVSADPLLPLRSYHDIGGAGANADLYVIWVVQFVDREIRVLGHYASQGQSLAYHAAWMRERGFEKCEIILPHDGANTNNVTSKRYVDHWREAGFMARDIPNQGRGAAAMRIEALRRLFPQIWFNESTTEDGRTNLGLYAPKFHPTTGQDLGPDHEYSHDADALGLMAIDYRPPQQRHHSRPLRPAYGTVA